MPPKRIQRKRVKGWRMPPNTVYVGRPSKWGNPFVVGDKYKRNSYRSIVYRQLLDKGRVTSANCLRLFRAYVDEHSPDWFAPLRGKDLACWCKEGATCHADILLELANAPQQEN